MRADRLVAIHCNVWDYSADRSLGYGRSLLCHIRCPGDHPDSAGRPRVHFAPHDQADMHSELCDAAGRGDVRVMRRLLADGADPDVATADGNRALMYAAIVGSADAIALLLDAGAAVNARSGDGSSALMKAALWGHPGVVATLLAHGADATLQDTGRWTALSLALQQAHSEVITLLTIHFHGVLHVEK